MIYYDRIEYDFDDTSMGKGFHQLIIVGVGASRKKLRSRSSRLTSKLHKRIKNILGDNDKDWNDYKSHPRWHTPIHVGMRIDTYDFVFNKLNRGQSIRSYLKGKR